MRTSILAGNRTAPVLIVVLMLCLLPDVARAMDADEFINRMRTTFRQTATIYLEAESHRIGVDGTASDTMYLTLAYAYPDRILQYVRGDGNRRQILLYDGDSMVLSYPHIDVEQRQAVTQRQFSRALVERVPFSALFLGLASDRLSADSITVETESESVRVRYPANADGSNHPRVEGRFTRDKLHPTTFIIENRGIRHRVKIERYEEEERFPLPVERALKQMNPGLLEANSS